MKKIKKLLPVDRYDFRSMEKYFSEMSSKGLHYCELRGDYVSFFQGESQYVRYEIIPVDKKKFRTDWETEAYYMSLGWEMLEKVNSEYMLFRTSNPDAGSLRVDTDVENAAMDNLIRRIKRSAVWSTLLYSSLVGIFLYVAYIKSLSAISVVKNGNAVLTFILIYPMTLIMEIYRASSDIRKVRLWASEAFSGEIRYVSQIKIRIRRAGSFLWGLMLWLLISSPLSGGYYRQIDNVTYPIPLVSLYDILPEDDFVIENEEKKWGNGSYSVQIQKSVFGEMYIFNQTGSLLTETDENSSSAFGSVNFRYEVYDIGNDYLAERLFEDVVNNYRKRSLYLSEEAGGSDLDRFFYLADGDEQYIIARKDNVIMSGRLWINTASDNSSEKYSLMDHLELVEAALDYERELERLKMCIMDAEGGE